MHSLSERVLSHILRLELLSPGDRVGVAVSGGIDSVALLRVLLELRGELGIVLSVVHFNHKLRGAESDADQEFVAGVAREQGLEFYLDSDDTAGQTAEEHIGIEAAARELRYGFFCHLLSADESDDSVAPPKSEPQGLKPSHLAVLSGTAEAVPFPNSTLDSVIAESKVFSEAALPSFPNGPCVNKIATGHTLDDQAETVLMRLIRGTGLRGLGAIHPRLLVDDDEDDDSEETAGEIIRPLLGIRRRELEQYLKHLKQPWREDSSNTNTKFTRNRMRRLVLPLLEREFNPAVAENLAELADIARGEEDYWENEVSGWLGTVVQWVEPEWARGLVPAAGSAQSLVQIMPSDPELLRRLQEPGPRIMNASVSRMWLLGEPIAVQRRLVKAIGEHAGIPLEFKHIEEILRLAAEEHGARKELSLPLGWKAVCEAKDLIFLTPDLRKQERMPQDYEYVLTCPGRASIPETGTIIEALSIPPGWEAAGYNPQQLLDAELLRGPLTVRNWRAGDRFWPVHTKSEKKIKELLQERHVAQPGRKLWPVIVSDGEIVWVRDFYCSAKFRPRPDREAVLIRETSMAESSAT